MARAKSIHIGLNFVDPQAYNGWDGELSGCINDANDLRSIAQSLSYETSLMTDSQATSVTVLQSLANAAQELTAGDILWVTYSGHGGQVFDANDDEDDSMDETWVLWDREVVDDELFALWSQFAAGVRICVLSDSCHSGTMLKMTVARQFEKTVTKSRDIQTRGKSKDMPRDIQIAVNQRDRPMYDTVQLVAGPSHRAHIGASVLLISGCQDNQLSYDGGANGLFTGTLKSVWNDGAFNGTYSQFHQAILDQMPPDQSPNYYTVGTQNQAFEDQKPFTPTSPNGSSPAPPVTSARPTLRQGDRGDDVRHMQERLVAHGHNVSVDGIFASGTAAAVIDFQREKGLAADGIVGSGTWAALEAASSGGTEPAPAPTPTPTPTPTPDPAPSPAPSGDHPTLREGDRGADVERMQNLLFAADYNVTPDGIFGARTESLVRSFQRDHGLDADGIVGESTWEELEWYA